MKVIDRQLLLALNASSARAGRRQCLAEDLIADEPDRKYVVNFHFDHEWKNQKDVRLSVILRPGALSAWLDVSKEEYDLIPEVEMSELEWEAAVCVGVPPWTE